MSKRLIHHSFTRMGMTKSKGTLSEQIAFGSILEFSYGAKQVRGERGGWKTDPKPSLLIFHDDGSKHVEGLNTHYLSYYYIAKLLKLLRKYPGINGTKFYSIIKSTAPQALKKGYRKYLRSSINPKVLFTDEG